VAAAAANWSVAAGSLSTENGFVVEKAGSRKASYGSLAADAAKLSAPSSVALKERADWKLLGKSQPRTDLMAKVTGKAEFGIDVDLPEMLYATVKMSPRFGAKAKSVNDKKALEVKGVTKIVPISAVAGHGFGVIAENTWAAFKGAEALEVEWEEATYPADTQAQMAALRAQLQKPADFVMRDDGDVSVAFADAPREELIEAEYAVPFLAHACMEPMNATARWKDGVLDIWSPNQGPAILQMVTAPLVGVEAADVRVHTTFLGGGFGRRAEADFNIYAVLLAKETNGRPVKVTWTREEDMRHDTYRPAAMAKMKARFKKNEGPVAVDMAIAAPSVVESVIKRTFPSISPMGPDKSLTDGSHNQPLKIANYKVAGHKTELGIPVGFWRSVGNSFNGFFHEGFLDEIATASGVDPLDMRLKLMADFPAATGVLKKVAEMSGWGRDPGPGRGLGIAHTLSFGAWVAQVAEVHAAPEGIRIENLWCAVEIGQAMDPGIVRAQMMSGIVFGLSSALGQEITFANGEVEQSNFTDFEPLRMNQCPKIEVEILETFHKMGGAGEPGTPPSIPALANAIYKATGKRLRSMPFGKEVKFA
jgi:isoquinoline 1-oxidoreductase beta subunit